MLEIISILLAFASGMLMGARLHWRLGASVHDAYGKEQRRRGKLRRKNLVHSHQQIDDAIRALRKRKKDLDAAKDRKKPQPPQTHKLSGHDYDEYSLL